MSEDTIKVNMNVYDIPIVVEQLKKLGQENKQLKERLKNEEKVAQEYLKLEEKIDKAIEEMKTIKQHYEELRKAPFEDSVFQSDMLRQSFILSIESYLELFLEILGG